MTESLMHMAELEWTEDGQPFSRQFGDLYSARSDGLAESRYVFLEGNRLASRFSALAAGDSFVIGEAGFGTGLNFLSSWALWKETAPDAAQLHFISVERFPLMAEELSRALRFWPSLKDQAEALYHAYPRCISEGFHRLVFDGGSVSLTLIIDDVMAGFDQLMESSHPAHKKPRKRIDAWFLDGFAPGKNPGMWQPELFRQIQQLSAPGASFATFTAAGKVRRALEAAGFEVSKAPGFGPKRHMLRGCLREEPALPCEDDFPERAFASPYGHAWQLEEQANDQQPLERARRIAVIGGGLAGCHIANALARRGDDVRLFEQGETLAAGASGNTRGLLYARLSHRQEPLAAFNLAALQYAQRHYRRLFVPTTAEEPGDSGVLQVAVSDKDRAQQAKIIKAYPHQDLFRRVDAEEASELAGIGLNCGGLLFTGPGNLDPRTTCAALAQVAGITIIHKKVTALENTQSAWTLLGSHAESLASVDAVVLACAESLSQFSQCASLPTQAVRGQVSSVPTAHAGNAANLGVALCAEGYVAPANDGEVIFGASFKPGVSDLSLRDAEHAENLLRMHRQFPGLFPEDLSPALLTGRAAYRCATPDRLPLVGPIPDHEAFIERFMLLRKNARASIAGRGRFHEGLYVLAGLGSRGLAYAPLAAEILAERLHGEPPSIGRDLSLALHPGRFLVRDLARNRA